MGMLRRVEDVLKKNSLYDELKGECDMHGADVLIMCLGDFNGHVRRHIVEFDGLHECIAQVRRICKLDCY